MASMLGAPCWPLHSMTSEVKESWHLSSNVHRVFSCVALSANEYFGLTPAMGEFLSHVCERSTSRAFLTVCSSDVWACTANGAAATSAAAASGAKRMSPPPLEVALHDTPPAAARVKSPAMRRVTLSQFLVSRQRDKNLINADLRLLIETIARACKAISTRVNKGALADGLGSAGSQNVQ